MKNYYQIFSVPENSSHEDIKKAFRTLAFKYHPDTNPGNEQQAEEKFKEINEAYGVLGDEVKRQQYDSARKGLFTSDGYDRVYSQQNIFRGVFSNRTMVDEMNRMFASAGLRFDQDFLNRTFFSGSGVMYQFNTSPSGTSGPTAYQQDSRPAPYQSNFIERWLYGAVVKISRFLLRQLFGLRNEGRPAQNLDHNIDFEISQAEASRGGEKQVTYRRDGQTRKLMVKIPARVKSGTKIRLKGMGMKAGSKTGNLYLHINLNKE
ncbi:DnaJ domain-containing protein [Chloroflexota bacterium]